MSGKPKGNGLRWLGGDEPTRWVPGTPARDLDQHDLEREVFKAVGLNPGEAGFADAMAALIDGLTGNGLYASAQVAPFHPDPAPAAASAAAAVEPGLAPVVPSSPDAAVPAAAAPEEK